MAFNITGDGKWNLFAGSWGSGYYWDGSQWVDDPSLVSGLLRSSGSTPTIAFNITGDGRWNLIEGGHGFYGYYWNGTQWISDSSLVTGLVGGSCSDSSIAFNITGGGVWNPISGYWDGGIHGHYWNGSRWIGDSSLVAGLVGLGEAPTPTMAFNITGAGKWNLIAGIMMENFLGETKNYRGTVPA